jgi:hypothetical protein
MEEEDLKEEQMSNKPEIKLVKENREETTNKEKILGIQTSIESYLGVGNKFLVIKSPGMHTSFKIQLGNNSETTLVK